jgi:alginate O-acetyltransferase complex protein AlgI
MPAKQVHHTTLVGQRSSSWLGWLPLLGLPFLVLSIHEYLLPWQFMWMLVGNIYLGLKWVTWWKAENRKQSPLLRSLAYLLAWPGMDAEAFLHVRRDVLAPSYREWLLASFKTMFGACLFWGVARHIPDHLPLLRGWVGMLGLVVLLHFGSFHILSLFWRFCGVDAQPIMCAPLQSASLSEFWGRRWNLGFRQLAHDLVFRPLKGIIGVSAAGFIVFLVSGLVHDLVISVPAQSGYGLPTLYFVAQGAGIAVERSSFGRHLGLRQGWRGWVFMALVTSAPAFWLFHPPFVFRVILPFLRAVHAL